MTILGGKGKGGVETPGWCIRTAHILDLNITVLQDTAPHREAWLNKSSPGVRLGKGKERAAVPDGHGSLLRRRGLRAL
jgi:hypothetical protein